MATNKATVPNIDNSDPANFPNARIKDNDGTGNGTPVNRLVYSDLHEYFAKLMRLAAIAYNGLPDSEGNGYQLIDAAIALAGKNDFITALNTINILVAGVATDVISVPLKLSTLKVNEALICKATFNHTDETLIQGSEPALQTVTFGGNFKTNDYIRFIKTNVGVTLIRLADDLNLDVLATELHYLKATTAADEYTGATQLAATTPYTNQLAFARRVIGLDSGMFLASATRNGLLSAAQWSILQAIPDNPVKNVGWFSGVDPGGGTIGSHAPVSGDVTDAIITNLSGTGAWTTYRVTLANAMTGTNYFVRVSVRSEGTLGTDVNIQGTVFSPASATQFDFAISQNNAYGGVQNLKIHIEAVQLS